MLCVYLFLLWLSSSLRPLIFGCSALCLLPRIQDGQPNSLQVLNIFFFFFLSLPPFFLFLYSLQGNGSQHFSQLLRRLPFIPLDCFCFSSSFALASIALLAFFVCLQGASPLKAFPLVLDYLTVLSLLDVVLSLRRRSHYVLLFLSVPVLSVSNPYLGLFHSGVLWRYGVVF